MLEAGTVVELVLPGHEAPIRATILSCSATMQSVRLQELQSQAVHRLSLKKLPFTVVHKPGQVPAAHGKTQGSAGGQPDGPQHAEQQQQIIEGLVGGDGAEEGGDAARRGTAEQQQQQDSGSRDGGSMGAERDDGLSSEDDSEGRQQGGSDGEDGEEAEDAAGGSDEEGEEAGALDAFPPATTAAVDAFAAMIEADPAAFLQPTAELAELAKGAAKALYDYQAGLHAGSSGDGTAGPAAVLPELYIEGFDAEQIWLQLELAAGPALKRARKLLKKAGQEPELLTPETEEAIDELLEGASDEEPLPGSDDDEDSEEQDADVAGVADLADLDYDALLAAGAAHQRQRQAAGLGSDDDEEQVDGAAAVQLAGSKRKRSAAAAAARAAVEDDHFKLDEMEAFLEQAEREAEGFDDDVKEGDGEPGSDDEEAALEALLDEAAAKTNRDKKKAKKARKSKRLTFGEEQDDDDEAENIGAAAMYEDFFGPRRGGQQGPTTVAAGGKHQFEEEDAQEEGSQEEDEEEDEDGFEDDLLSDDMLSGEEGEGEEHGRPHGLANGGAAGEYSDEEDEDMEDGDEEEEAAGQAAVLGSRRALLAASDEDEDEEGELGPSAHERRQQRMRDKIKKLEEAALGEKEWFMRGEIDAGHRPKNSALEVDLDFETTVKPPPQPTEEMTQTLDELIKRRIAEARFDDVVRIVAPPPETKRTTLELDDSKPQQGLGEIYEQEYMQTVAGVADDKDEEVRQAARAQFSALCTKLDALSHLHFTPRPVIEEVTVKVDVPAIMMEEAAPQFVSGVSMRAPEEVFASEAAGAPRAEEELTREERKRQRAQRKRSGKKRRAAKEEERAARAISQGGTAALADRRSAAAEEAARKLEKAAKKGRRADTSRKGEYTKSTNVFSKIQQHADGTAALAPSAPAPRAAHLKL